MSSKLLEQRGDLLRVHSITLPEDVKNIELLPLSDMHIGDKDFDRRAFIDYINYVKAEPNRFVLLNGDIMNNAIKSSVSDIYEEILSPREQITEAVVLLTPIKDRIWGIISGNHERRTDKESGISPVEIIADKLGVPYFGVQALIKLKLGVVKKKCDRQVFYMIYATHGYAGGRMRGGKVNALERLKNIVLCDVYCLAHTHGQISFPSVIYEPQRHCDSVIERVMWFVNSGSFLKRGEGYAAAKGYEPQLIGCPIIELSGTEKKISVVQGRL